MWLKLITTVCLFTTVGLMLFRPAIVGPLPHKPVLRHALLLYSERSLAFTGALILAVTGSGVGAIILVRKAKEEYRRLSLQNMQSLIEATIQDHKKAPGTQDEPVE